MDYAFVIGLPENQGEQEIIDKEAQKFGDLLQFNFKDAYRNNSRKVSFGATGDLIN